MHGTYFFYFIIFKFTSTVIMEVPLAHCSLSFVKFSLALYVVKLAFCYSLNIEDNVLYKFGGGNISFIMLLQFFV